MLTRSHSESHPWPYKNLPSKEFPRFPRNRGFMATSPCGAPYGGAHGPQPSEAPARGARAPAPRPGALGSGHGGAHAVAPELAPQGWGTSPSLAWGLRLSGFMASKLSA